MKLKKVTIWLNVSLEIIRMNVDITLKIYED